MGHKVWEKVVKDTKSIYAYTHAYGRRDGKNVIYIVNKVIHVTQAIYAMPVGQACTPHAIVV